jgi:hypothetical protein
MTRTTAYQKRHAKTRQRRRRLAAERLQRDHAQAQRAIEALEQALHDVGLPDNRAKEIEGRLRTAAAGENLWRDVPVPLWLSPPL